MTVCYQKAGQMRDSIATAQGYNLNHPGFARYYQTANLLYAGIIIVFEALNYDTN